MAYVKGTFTAELLAEHSKGRHRDFGSHVTNCPKCKAKFEKVINDHDKGKHSGKPHAWCGMCINEP